jgi:hypothetical protein
VVIDHLALLVPDAAAVAARLRADHGLGSERGMFYERAGTRHWTVPLVPPQALEFVAIEDRDLAERTDDGRRMLACEQAGYGFVGWAVLVKDLEAVSERLGIAIFDYTIPQGDGTLRGWRVVDGPAHLPFFIDYPNNGDRAGRLQASYHRVDHRCAPQEFSELTISGSAIEMHEWLGPNELPLRFVAGEQGLIEASITTANGQVVIR